MSDDPASVLRTTRRGLLSAASVLAALLATGQRHARADPDGTDPSDALPGDATTLTGATMLIGGPADGAAFAFASLAAPLIAPALFAGGRPGEAQSAGRITLQPTGGADGVTAANAFDARATQDGTTALMVPGSAALAWLAGDPRVHFDAGLWVPVFAATAPAVLVGKAPLARGAALSLGASSPAGRELPALLALELMRIRVDAQFDIRVPEEAEAALRQGRVDAIVLSGRAVPERLQTLERDGFKPLFAIGGVTDATGQVARDPGLPHVATFDELFAQILGHAPAGVLLPAYRAAAAATRLDAALVLPQLASGSLVARWRSACDGALASLTFRAAAASEGLAPLGAPDCVEAVAATIAGETAQLDLHRFLADRYGWRPA